MVTMRGWTAVMLLCAMGCRRDVAAVDTSLFLALNSTMQTPVVDRLMLAVSNKWNFIIPSVALFVYWLITASDRKRVVRLTLAVLLLIGAVDGTATAIKRVVKRPRPCSVLAASRAVLPCANTPSFPSNHAANAFAVAAFIVAYTRRRAGLWFAAAALVGYSRIHLGVHYPLDVAGGALFGTGAGYLVGCGTRRLLQSPAPPGTPDAPPAQPRT